AYRDTLLRMSGRLNESFFGPSADLQSPQNVRRTVYGYISRGRTNALLRTYDFPDPMQTTGGRELTVTPLQQLFVMNSTFIHEAAEQLAAATKTEPDREARLTALFHKSLGRDATAKEIELAHRFLEGGTLEEFAQILLATNEEI